MAAMRAAKVNVIRWWMWPELLSDSIQWGDGHVVTGIGGTLLADVEAALELADQNDVYLMLTPFSFDSFKASQDVFGAAHHGLKDIILDPAKREALLENLIRPVAKAAAASPYANRLISWDLINEPEWAMTGKNLYGGSDFEPQSTVEAVTHAELETFLKEMIVVLREESKATITVGGAAIKWGQAWTKLDLDYYSPHYYDWVYEWFPYKVHLPKDYGMSDKPVLMGEYPYGGFLEHPDHLLPAVTSAQFVEDLNELGYVGALGWAFNDPKFPFDAALSTGFEAAHSCETAY